MIGYLRLDMFLFLGPKLFFYPNEENGHDPIFIGVYMPSAWSAWLLWDDDILYFHCIYIYTKVFFLSITLVHILFWICHMRFRSQWSQLSHICEGLIHPSQACCGNPPIVIKPPQWLTKKSKFPERNPWRNTYVHQFLIINPSHICGC